MSVYTFVDSAAMVMVMVKRSNPRLVEVIDHIRYSPIDPKR